MSLKEDLINTDVLGTVQRHLLDNNKLNKIDVAKIDRIKKLKVGDVKIALTPQDHFGNGNPSTAEYRLYDGFRDGKNDKVGYITLGAI